MQTSFILSSQTTKIKTLTSNQLTRSIRIHFPSSTSNTAGKPLVINMHGYSSDALQQEFYARMNEVADREGFLVVYPDGINNAWNVGWPFGSPADDVKFMSDIIDYMVQTYQIDGSKVYACGMSNGGFMSYYLACHLSEKIAAIASVTGSMVPRNFDVCKPEVYMPILEIHGTKDDVVPYQGLDPIAAPIEDVIQFWVENNGCSVSPQVYEFPNTNITDNTTSTKYTYRNCNDNVEVQFIVVDNGGHTWPGSLIDIGTTSRDFSASEEIWKFFKSYSRKVTSTTIEDVRSNPKIHIDLNGYIHILNDKSDEVVIFDMAGKVTKHFYFNEGESTISISDLPTGIYNLYFKHQGYNARIVKH